MSLCALSACERNEKVIAVEYCRHRQCSCKSLSSPHQAREVIKLLKKALVRTKVQIDIAAYNKFSLFRGLSTLVTIGIVRYSISSAQSSRR